MPFFPGIEWFGGNQEPEFRSVKITITNFTGNGTLKYCTKTGYASFLFPRP